MSFQSLRVTRGALPPGVRAHPEGRGRARSLDRHWYNAQTITSLNPRVNKDRIVGDYAVPGTSPHLRWRVGEV